MSAAPSWWLRNRLALLSIIPLLLLALAGNAYRLVTLYRPNEYTQAQRATGSTLAYDETFRVSGHPYRRRVDLRLLAVRPIHSSGELIVPAGAQLWEVDLELRASPETVIDNCTMELISARGERFNDVAGKTYRNGHSESVFDHQCTPEDTPGPRIDFLGELEPAEKPRPEVWTIQRTLLLPANEKPVALRVMWQPPHYAQLSVGGQP